MASNKKPRKKYVQKPSKQIPIGFGISSDDSRILKIIPHTELEKLRTGTADDYAWNTITCRLNFGYVLANNHEFGIDLKEPLRQALDAMVSIKERYASNQRWICKGDELKAIGAAINYTDEIQYATTRRNHRDALKVVLTLATE